MQRDAIPAARLLHQGGQRVAHLRKRLLERAQAGELLRRTIWGYVSLGYFKQKLRDGEVGSSTVLRNMGVALGYSVLAYQSLNSDAGDPVPGESPLHQRIPL